MSTWTYFVAYTIPNIVMGNSVVTQTEPIDSITKIRDLQNRIAADLKEGPVLITNVTLLNQNRV